MPELPEVETIKLGLQKYLIGHSIQKIEVHLPKILTGNTNHVLNTRIIDIKRFGKGLIIELSNSYSIAIHIKMTGQLIYQGPNLSQKTILSSKVGTLPNKFSHVIFQLDNQGILYYNDIRQFGWVKIISTKNIKNISFFKNLGPEPLKNLTLKIFNQIISTKKSPVKILLMDQKKIGGIGNIYANEALFLAKILPTRPGSSLSVKEIKALFNSIEKVLKKGIHEGGASETNFVNAIGLDGKYQKYFLIYGKENKPCSICSSPIKKIQLEGRGTYYCTKCQR